MKEYVIEDGVIKIKFNTRQKGYVTVLFDIQDEEFVSKYITRLYIDNKRIYVGKFNTLDEAKEALERRKKLAL